MLVEYYHMLSPGHRVYFVEDFREILPLIQEGDAEVLLKEILADGELPFSGVYSVVIELGTYSSADFMNGLAIYLDFAERIDAILEDITEMPPTLHEMQNAAGRSAALT
jgi:hypothetical protein